MRLGKVQARRILDAAVLDMRTDEDDPSACLRCGRRWNDMPYPLCAHCRATVLTNETGVGRDRTERLAVEAVVPQAASALDAAIQKEHWRQDRVRKAKPNVRDLERVMYVLDGFPPVQVATFTRSNLVAIGAAMSGTAGRRVADVLVALRDQLRPEGEM